MPVLLLKRCSIVLGFVLLASCSSGSNHSGQTPPVTDNDNNATDDDSSSDPGDTILIGDPGDDDGDPFVPPPPPPPPAPITNSADAARTGWYPNQPGLSPAIVGGSTFGRRFAVNLPGGSVDQVYAQPLVFNGRVLVATEANNVYSLDSETGEVMAMANLGDAWKASDLGCGDLVPTVGITGTPVIDAVSGVLYLFAKTYDTNNKAAWQAHALDAMTLNERAGFPVTVSGAADNDASFTFNPLVQMQRPGLLLMDGIVYGGFGGHCDIGNYNGWLVGISAAGDIVSMFATETGEEGVRGSAIWQSGTGLMSDGPGQIYFVTGNTFSPAGRLPTPGNTPPGVLGEAMVHVSVDAEHHITPVDFFIPYDVVTLDNNDADFGSGGPVALPAQFATADHPHIAVAVGKAGVLYVFDRDALGGFKQGQNGDDAVLGRLNVVAGAWSRPGVWPGDGGLIYLVLNKTRLQALQFAVNGSGEPSFARVGQGETELGYTSGSPIITSDATTSGSALVWTVATTGAFGNGELRAYDPVPDQNGVLTLRYADGFGAATKFFTPGVGDGRLYVGTRDGRLIAYGAPTTSPIASAATDYGTVIVNTSVTKLVSIRASVPLTVTSLTSSSADFVVDTTGAGLPRTLAADETITVSVTFMPSESGLAVAALDIATSAGDASATLRGAGQPAGPFLVLSSPFVSFGGVTTGDTRTVNVIAKNIGAQALTISSFTPPAAPFFLEDAPAAGSLIAANGQVTFTVGFHPTAPGTNYNGHLDIASNGGAASIGMSGTAANAGVLTITPDAVHFGSVAVGAGPSTRTFAVSNTGGTYIIIAKSKPPIVSGFGAPNGELDEGTRLNPGATRTVHVTFDPADTGFAQAAWVITATDGSGVHNVVVDGTGTP